MKLTSLLLLLIPMISVPGLASTPKLYVIARPCTISIQSVQHSGRREGVRFTTKFRSPAECRQLAELHRPNFEGALVRQKKVTYVWNVTPKIRKPTKFIRGYTRTPIRRMKPVFATFRRR